MFRSSSLAQHRPLPATVAPAPAVFEIHRSRVQVRQIQPQDRRWLPALAELLVDGVHHGASLGPLAPLSRHQAMDHWERVLAGLGPQAALWVALESDEGPLRGCVQLHAHAASQQRGELRQLIVHSSCRGRGIASQLLNRLECTALDQGRTLLVLEAPSGSQAEGVFAHLDWRRAGEIPDADRCAEGRPHANALYYKRLATPLK